MENDHRFILESICMFEDGHYLSMQLCGIQFPHFCSSLTVSLQTVSLRKHLQICYNNN